MRVPFKAILKALREALKDRRDNPRIEGKHVFYLKDETSHPRTMVAIARVRLSGPAPGPLNGT